MLAQIHSALRNAAATESAAAEAFDIAQQHRFPQWLAFAQQWRGWALCRLGDAGQGLALLEEGQRRLHAIGNMLHTTRTHCFLAEGCVLAGRPDAALSHVEAAHRHAETYGEHFMSAEIHRLHAEVLQIQGAPAPEVDRLERWVVMQAPTGQRFCVVRIQRPGFPKNANRWD
jgi:predicted ATPase